MEAPMNCLAALAALLVASAGPLQDPQDHPGIKNPEDPPMPGPKSPPKSGTCCEEGRVKPWPGYNKGVKWTIPLSAAALEARNTGKLLLVFHLVGDMDKEGC